MKNIVKNTLFIFLSAVILSGCGDGGRVPIYNSESSPESESGSGSGATGNVTAPAVTAPVVTAPVVTAPAVTPPAVTPLPDPLTGEYSLKECMEFRPGTSFERSDQHKTLLVQETFLGEMAFGVVLLRPDDTRAHTWYRQIGKYTDGEVQGIGEVEYDQMGNLFSTTFGAISFPTQAPLNIQQTVRYQTDTTTVGPPPVTAIGARFWDISFAGFETLTLGGRRFDNVCIFHVVEQRNRTEVHWFWFAKGFGEIKRELRDLQGVRVPNSPGFVLTRVIAAP